MAEKKFLMFSLEDKETKKIANVVSNDSCRKILDALAEKSATESELAAMLKAPLSTIHYNLKQLVDVGLVSADEFHYSEKGKEVLHYKLANKYIIITPKAVTGIKDKLRKILPVAAISAGVGGILQLVSQYASPLASSTEAIMPYGAEGVVMRKAASSAADSSMMQTMAASAPAPTIPVDTFTLLSFDIALWFFVGALFGVIVYLVLAAVRKEE